MVSLGSVLSRTTLLLGSWGGAGSLSEAPNPDPVQLSHQAFPTRSRRTQSAPPSLRSTTQQPNGVSRTPGPVILRDARVLPALCLESSISHSWFRVGATQNPWWYGSILKPHRKKSVGGDPWKPWWPGPSQNPAEQVLDAWCMGSHRKPWCMGSP